ncbi:hypothetical protein DFQ28_000179 [Apophysomyces sp. BC1034]|nr:hypothetical protein DFQ30_000131 [Apophysomyces sp. BC1015]KAG0168249.1 hypothetical protein DFQ29_010226 [Apophysomyces sp. BC1021]KAG0184079.1 hypothetical protein DFQ28_000179 [Apophysomyces sp. BC1034]
MSSVSSHEGSEKDSHFYRTFPDGLASRYAYMRKTDLLDTFDSGRTRDTDTWSVAATIDDQESVISGLGGTASIVSSSRMTVEGRETDDDRSTLDGMHDGGSVRDSFQLGSSAAEIAVRLETLRDLDGPQLLQDNMSSVAGEDGDDKRSRSNAAEFGDDGTRSAAADFDHSETSDDEHDAHTHDIVNDDISAPPQPQPSFASVTKSYAELMEENEMLHNRLRSLQLTQKHQADVIENLRSLTGCGEEVYGKALDLSHVRPEELEKASADAIQSSLPVTHPASNSSSGGGSNSSSSHEELDLDHTQVPPIVNARTLTQRLARLAELLTTFVQDSVTEDWRITLEQFLFTQITEHYLVSLPFGTENQELLNTAYSDQIRRFQNTLGSNFAKWYRRQTVQSLSLNLATKEYLQQMREKVTEKLVDLLKKSDRQLVLERQWDDILDLCTALSLEIHGGDADVSAQPIAAGSKYDEEIMAVIGSVSTDNTTVKLVVSPLFIDEDETVLLPARVLLE